MYSCQAIVVVKTLQPRNSAFFEGVVRAIHSIAGEARRKLLQADWLRSIVIQADLI